MVSIFNKQFINIFFILLYLFKDVMLRFFWTPYINHDRADYHLENLRWISHVNNSKNQTSNKNVVYQYIDEIPIESIKVDFYETKKERHEFENYYYWDGVFYYDNDINYKIIHINLNSINCKTISIRDINGKKVSIVINRFLRQHDLL